MNRIPIVNRTDIFALVDDADYDLVKSKRWYFKKDSGGCACREGNKLVDMAIFIMGRRPKLHIDHIDHNRLNNQRSNLRFVTLQQNNFNRQKTRFNKVGFLGVCPKRKTKYVAQIQFNKKKIHIGIFLDPVEAAKARDEKAKELFGEYAGLNFK